MRPASASTRTRPPTGSGATGVVWPTSRPVTTGADPLYRRTHSRTVSRWRSR